MEEYILGLDASTTTIGVCVMNLEDGSLIELTHLSLDSKSDDEKVIFCGKEFEKYLIELLKKYPQISYVGIEKAFVAMYGLQQSSAHTTALLNQVNAIYRWICHKHNLKVRAITVSEARKIAFPSLRLQSKAKAKISQKEQIFAHVIELIGDKYFPTKTITRGKNVGNIVFEDYCLDRSDAYVVAKCLNILLNLGKENKIKK